MFIKNITLFITFFLTITVSFLQADDALDYVTISAYENNNKTIFEKSDTSETIFKDINISIFLLKSHDSTITKDTIINYTNQFDPLNKKELFQDLNTSYWLKIDLGSDFPSGEFVYTYGDADFSQHTIKETQFLNKFQINGVQCMQFVYRATLDPQVYYFKLVPRQFKTPFRFLSVSSIKDFYKSFDKQINFLLIAGIILGIILMAAIFNASIFYYNRDKSFLYYMLMQFSMFGLLLNTTDIFFFEYESFFARNFTYESLLSLSTILFATLFNMHFLDTKQRIPSFHIFLQVIVCAIILDIFITLIDESFINKFSLYQYFILPFLYTGFKRALEGYKPAYFYLVGWIILLISVILFTSEFEYKLFLYIGAGLEAILLSIAISYKIQMVNQEKEEQKKLLIQQSKLASMGEMISVIAHQWRQPLTHLSYIFMNINQKQKHEQLNSIYLKEKIDEANLQLTFMSDTIEDFQSFYKPDKEKENFSLLEATNETLNIMKNSFKQHSIEVELILNEDTTLYNFKNEYKQVLVNLLSNAKDAFIQREISHAKITISIDKNCVSIQDNALGIEPDIFSNIFDPYFSTKETNTGIGLYMSKIIIEKSMQGVLTLKNHSNGLKCTLIL